MVAFVLDIVAVALTLVTGWLGGELVDRLAIGVSAGANPDAPSSLRTPTAAPAQRRTQAHA